MAAAKTASGSDVIRESLAGDRRSYDRPPDVRERIALGAEMTFNATGGETHVNARTGLLYPAAARPAIGTFHEAAPRPVLVGREARERVTKPSPAIPAGAAERAGNAMLGRGLGGTAGPGTDQRFAGGFHPLPHSSPSSKVTPSSSSSDSNSTSSSGLICRLSRYCSALRNPRRIPRGRGACARS